MNEKEVIDTINELEAQGAHHQLPIVWKRAWLHYVWDINYKKYLDFGSTIFVANCGHTQTYKAIQLQAEEMIHCYTYPSEIKAKLLKKLIDMTPEFCEKVAFFSAGTEATEVACKIMKMYSHKKDNNKYPKIIFSISGAMHGKTYLAEQLKHNGFEWREPSNFIYNLNYPQKDEEFKVPYEPSQIGGFIIESYEGWSARFLPKKWMQGLVNFAKTNDIPICFDEIQSGFGRTGKFFAYEHYEVEPDLLCLGKALGNGVPISAVIGRKKLLDMPDDISSTNSGNPLCCASALASLEYFEENNLSKKSEELGLIIENFMNQLKDKYSNVIMETNTKGLLSAIIFKSEELATKICYKCMENKLIVVWTGRESIKLAPPLTINEYDLQKGLDIFEQSIKNVLEVTK